MENETENFEAMSNEQLDSIINEESNDFMDKRSPEAQAIIDAELGVEPQEEPQEDDELQLPSEEGEEPEPELLAGKYKDVDALKKGIVNIGSNLPEYVINGMSSEALEQHYSELQKSIPTEKRGRKHAEKKVEEPEPELPKKTDDGKKVDIGDELWGELDTTFKSTGTITSEQYDKLNNAGIPDTMIDRYLDGIKAEQVSFTNDAYALAGSKEEFEGMKSWAEDNQPEVVSMLNKMTDYKQMLAVMKGVKADYVADVGSSQGNTLRGHTRVSSGAGYTNQSDYIADVNDIRYKTDARFRDKVKAKLSKSDLTN